MNDIDRPPERADVATVDPAVVELSTAEALGLLAAAGVAPRLPSPLAGLERQPCDPGADARRSMSAAGWLGGAEHPLPTTTGRAVLERLATPQRRTDLLLGTGSWWFTWVGLGAGQQDTALLTVTDRAGDGHLTVSYPHPAAQPTELIATHLRIGRVAGVAPFEVELSDAAAVTWAGVLDDRLDAQLGAALDRTPVRRRRIDVDDVLDALAEGRTGSDLSWQVPVTGLMWPDLDLAIEPELVSEGLAELARHGIVVAAEGGHGYELSELGSTLIGGLVPVARWASVTHVRRTDARPDPTDPDGTDPVGALSVERIGIRRGVGASIVERRLADGGMSIRSVDDHDLERLIASLDDVTRAGQRPARSEPPTNVTTICSACDTVLHTAAHFCHSCGRPVDEGPS